VTPRCLRLLLWAAVFALWLVRPAVAWADTCEERARAIARGVATMAGETDCDRAGVYAAAATVSVAAAVVSVAAATLGIGLAATGASGLGSLFPLPGGATSVPSPSAGVPSPGGATHPGPGPVHEARPEPSRASDGGRPPSRTTAKSSRTSAAPGKGVRSSPGQRAGAHDTADSHSTAEGGPAGTREMAGQTLMGTPSPEVLAHLPSDEIRHAVLSLFSPGKVVGWKFHDIEHFREEYWKAKALENVWEAHQTQDHVVFLFSSEFGITESAARSLLELPKALWEPVATVIASIAH
jgi:hypothetical protein